jgi:hypothetical protein
VGAQHSVGMPTNAFVRTVKSCGPDLPVLRSRAMRKHCRGCDDARHRRKTGATKPVPEESAYKPLPIAQGMPVDRLNLWYLPPAFFPQAGHG